MTKKMKFLRKRDGGLVKFEKKVITDAIYKAFLKTGQGNYAIAQAITESVVEQLILRFPSDNPTVEDVQEIVEDTLIEYNLRNAAKEYIRYRAERNRLREAHV